MGVTSDKLLGVRACDRRVIDRAYSAGAMDTAWHHLTVLSPNQDTLAFRQRWCHRWRPTLPHARRGWELFHSFERQPQRT